MKKHLPITALILGGLSLLAFAGPGPGAQDDAGQDDLTKRVEVLEAEVRALQGELADARKLLDQTTAYLEAQAKSAKDLQVTFDEAEKAGYTAGINYRSRELMLAGWRSYTGTLQKGVPGRKATEKETAAAKR